MQLASVPKLLTCSGDARYVLRRVTLPPAQGGQQFAPSRATTPLVQARNTCKGYFFYSPSFSSSGLCSTSNGTLK